jgi:anti-anti-sigma factor
MRAASRSNDVRMNLHDAVRCRSLESRSLMAVHNLSESILLITLPQEPDRSSELETAARLTTPRTSRHIIVDFSRVETMSSVTICGLIILNRLLSTAGRQLILCSVSPNVMAIFRKVGLSRLLQFVADKTAAQESLDRRAFASG